jgi:hypothetical protein
VLLSELECFIEKLPRHAHTSVARPVLQRISLCIEGLHIHVAEKAASILNNKAVLEVVSKEDVSRLLTAITEKTAVRCAKQIGQLAYFERALSALKACPKREDELEADRSVADRQQTLSEAWKLLEQQNLDASDKH